MDLEASMQNLSMFCIENFVMGVLENKHFYGHLFIIFRIFLIFGYIVDSKQN
jgi:hypothetical protein